MSLLTVTALVRRYADRIVFRDVSFRVARGDRVGVIGPNGSGKSTLLRAIAGREADEGSIVVAKNVRVGFLEQELDPGAGTIRDLVDRARSRLDAMEAELRSLEPRLSDAAALERYGEVQHAFEHAGGYDFEAQSSRVLGGLGLGAIDPARSLASLSGGERARASLAALLLSDPGLLLLDEPTNHLDLAALEWLETYLLEGERSLVVVSHDRYFLDRVTARTLALDGVKLRAYRGGYSAYARESAREALELERRTARQERAVERDEAFIERERAGQRARQARGRIKRLAKLEPIEEREGRGTIHWRPEAPPLGSETVIETTSLAVGFDAPILQTPVLRVARGARVAIMGPNGSGKTTLLRVLLGERFALEGHVRAAPGARVAHFAQSGSAPTPEGSVLTVLRGAVPLTEQQARDHLARFLFRGEDVFREARTLSGGERARLSLAILAARSANVLALDEPTNHLDLDAREALEQVLADFDGTILLVTHDRYLADKLATHTWLAERGELRTFEGNYSQMKKALEFANREGERRHAPGRGESAPGGPPRAGGSGPRAGAARTAGRSGSRIAEAKGNRDRRPEERGPGAAAARGAARRLTDLESRIAALERNLEELARKVAEVAALGNFMESRRVGQEYAELERALRELYDEWAKAGE